MTKAVIEQVKKDAEAHGIRSYKFKDRRGVTLLHDNWKAGVDYDTFDDEEDGDDLDDDDIDNVREDNDSDEDSSDDDDSDDSSNSDNSNSSSESDEDTDSANESSSSNSESDSEREDEDDDDEDLIERHVYPATEGNEGSEDESDMPIVEMVEEDELAEEESNEEEAAEKVMKTTRSGQMVNTPVRLNIKSTRGKSYAQAHAGRKVTFDEAATLRSLEQCHNIIFSDYEDK